LTFKDLKKRVNLEALTTRQQSRFTERLRNKPFWIWNIEEHKDTYMPIEVDRLEAQIMAYQWVQARLEDLVINNEDKDIKIRI
jgi:hypothetical protein